MYVQVGGFLQRIDYVRKHAFAAMCILKDDKAGTFPIRGLFLFRGQDIPPIMKEECYDVDLYNWQKVDINNPVSHRYLPALSPSPIHVLRLFVTHCLFVGTKVQKIGY